MAPHQLLPVPPVARARALGALIVRGEHAVAFTEDQADALLAGFCLEGLERDERVLVVAPDARPRPLAARLRAQGVAPRAARPSSLVIAGVEDRAALPGGMALQLRAAARDGYEGLRVARLSPLRDPRFALRAEQAHPRRFDVPLTMLCIYSGKSLPRGEHADAWALAAHHARILVA